MSILIIDLEMTCCEHDEFPKAEMELIEIGAAVVSEHTWNITGSFGCLVKPVLHPQLTKFCVNLLGIEQHDVDTALTPRAAWDRFLHLFHDDRFCSWGRGDLKWLKAFTSNYGLWFPFKQHGNLFHAIGSGQSRFLRRHKITWYGQRHRALNDAMTYAEMVIKAKPNIVYRDI